MKKRSLSFMVAIIGVIMIILAGIGKSFSAGTREKNELFIKENVIQGFKNCIKAHECHKNNILISEILRQGYISEEVQKLLEEYSQESYVEYPSFVVNLKK